MYNKIEDLPSTRDNTKQMTKKKTPRITQCVQKNKLHSRLWLIGIQPDNGEGKRVRLTTNKTNHTFNAFASTGTSKFH